MKLWSRHTLLALAASSLLSPAALHATTTVTGAYGDFGIIPNAGCSITAGASALTCSISIFKSTDVGKTIYISTGGASGATLATSISSFTSGTSVTLAISASSSVSGVGIAYGHDDTVALQNAYNAALTKQGALYVPSGNYLHHGLNWTGNSIKIYGDSYGGTMLYAFNVTNPSKTTSGAQTTGVDVSGSGYNEVDSLAFIGGWTGFADMAPSVNVLGARVGTSGNSFAIAHVFDNDFFLSWGPYDVMLYGYEQTSFQDCHFESDVTSNGILYLSAENTPAFKSPYATMVSAPTSMTKVSIQGARSVIAGAGKLVVFDQGSSEAVYSISISDAYSNISGGTFLSDTGTGALRGITLANLNIETNSCVTCQAVNVNGAAWNWQLSNIQFYTNGPGLSVPPYNFAGGFLDSTAMIDSTGQATSDGYSELMSPSCAGSTLQLGEEQPTTNCTDYASASGTGGTLPQDTTDQSQTSGSSTGWWKLGTFVAGSVGPGPTLIFSEGVGFNSLDNQQATSILTMRTGNDTVAPNLSGISVVTVQGVTGILAVKAVATGGSTAANNRSWDIYLEEANWSFSSYSVNLPQGSKWIPADTSASDPGTDSTTIVPGSINVAQLSLTATTSEIGGSGLSAGGCTSGTVAVPSATAGMAVEVTPVTYPGNQFYWRGYVSSAGTVTVAVCAAAAGTPANSTYNVRVLE